MQSNIKYTTPEWAHQKDIDRLNRSLKTYFNTVGKKERNGDKSFAYAANLDWHNAEKCPDHHQNFVKRKITAMGLRLFNSEPTAALRNTHGVMMTYLPASFKDGWCVNYPGKLAGSCQLIGDLNNSNRLIITVDYFSAVSLHMATRLPVAVTFRWLNVLPNVERFIKNMPAENIIIATNRAYQKESVQREQEAGFIAGGCKIIKPEAEATIPARQRIISHPDTWNDVHYCWGLDEINRQFSEAGLVGSR